MHRKCSQYFFFLLRKFHLLSYARSLNRKSLNIFDRFALQLLLFSFRLLFFQQIELDSHTELNQTGNHLTLLIKSVTKSGPEDEISFLSYA